MMEEALTPLEMRCLQGLTTTDEFDCGDRPTVADSWDRVTDWPERQVRAQVLVQALLARSHSPDPAVTARFTLIGACVINPLELGMMELRAFVTLSTCKCEDWIDLSGSGILGLSLDGTRAVGLRAAGSTVQGSLNISRSQVGLLDLRDAHVRGVVSASHSVLGTKDQAVRADRMSAGALVCTSATFDSEVRLVGAEVSGPLAFDECRLSAATGAAMTAEDCRVGGGFFLRLTATPRCEVNLAYAKVAGPLRAR